MAYSGYLLKAGGSGGTIIPTSYIQYNSYSVTPDQRLEISAERTADGVLVRETLSHTPTKIEFETKTLFTSELNALMAIITGAYTVAAERKLSLYYYDPINDAYYTGTFYVPDIKLSINREVSSSVLQYEPIRIAFIEY